MVLRATLNDPRWICHRNDEYLSHTLLLLLLRSPFLRSDWWDSEYALVSDVSNSFQPFDFTASVIATIDSQKALSSLFRTDLIAFFSFRFFIKLIEGNPLPFAFNYSFGHISQLLASTFLCGPKRQFRYVHACHACRPLSLVVSQSYFLSTRLHSFSQPSLPLSSIEVCLMKNVALLQLSIYPVFARH